MEKKGELDFIKNNGLAEAKDLSHNKKKNRS